MRIENIEMNTFMLPLKEPFKISKNIFNTVGGILIKITMDDGTFGLGESVQLITPWYSHETLKTSEVMIRDILIPQILKKEVCHARDLLNELKYVVGNHQSLASIDTAILDIESKQSGLPLYKYLGGIRDSIDIGTSIGLHDWTELRNIIEIALEKGYKRIKVKIAHGNDIEVIRTIRKYFPDIVLMVDANAAYSIKDIDIFKHLDEFGLLMIEQPFGNGDLLEHSVLQNEINTPVCLDESVHDLNDAKVAIELKACKIINVKPPRVGGPTNVREMLSYMSKKNIGGWIGGMLETGVGRVMNMACATLANANYHGDLRPPLDYLIEDITDYKFELINGKIAMPKASGLGIEIDSEKLKKYTISKYVRE